MENKNDEHISLKDEVKLINALSKLFPVCPTGEHLTIEEMQESRGYITPDNVCMIVCKTDIFREIFKRFTDKNDKKNNIPELSYTISEKDSGRLIKSKYSLSYIMAMMKCFDAIEESVFIQTKNDYPLTLDGKHFTLIVAPRIEND